MMSFSSNDKQTADTSIVQIVDIKTHNYARTVGIIIYSPNVSSGKDSPPLRINFLI